MRLDQSITNEDIREMYPTGVYYICATTINNPLALPTIHKVENSHNILGIIDREIVHAEDSKGCLYFKGTWAPLCDSKGNLLFDKEKEVSYEIY